MIDFIENIMDFIYRHQLFRKIFYYLFCTFLGVLVFTWILIYLNTGIANFDLALLFQSDTYFYLMNVYRKELALFLLVEQAVFIAIIVYQDMKIKKPLGNDKIEKIDIKELSKLWLGENEISLQDNLKQELSKPITAPIDTKTALLNVANFTEVRSEIFSNEVLKPNLAHLDMKQIEIIIKLIQLLEKNKDCPSVVSICDKEPNKIYGGDKDNKFSTVEIVTLDGLTRFDIFAKISLFEHSLSVASKIVDLLNKDKNLRGYKKSLLAKALIAALAHDIGKIKNYEFKKEKADFVSLRKQQPHQQISYMILYDSFKECPNLQEIAEVVKKHHSAVVEKDENLLKLLIDTDKGTRSQELDTYLKNHIAFKDKENINKKVVNQAHIETQALNNEKSLEIDDLKEPKENQSLESLNLEYLEQKFNDENFTENKKLFLLFTLEPKPKIKDLEKIFENFSFKDLEKEIYESKDELFILLKQGDRAKALNFFYDFEKVLKQTLEKSNLKIGFVMFRDCKDIKETINGAKKALEKAKANEKLVYADFKDYRKDDEVKIELFDTNTQTQEKDEQNKENTKDDKEQDLEMLELDETFKKIDEKVENMQVVGSKEENFDIQSIELKLFELLKEKINTFKQKGFAKIIQAISYRNFVLVSKECLCECLAQALNIKNENLEARANFLIRHYRYNPDENKRFIWYISVDKGFYLSKYSLIENHQKSDFYCIPFDSKRAFNMSASELESHKKASELAHIRVLSYSKK